jgi:4-amino-4-deoxychorismate lyase
VTPPLAAGVLPGTTRALLLHRAPRHGLKVKEATATVAQVLLADGAFLSVSTSGLLEISELDGHPLPSHPMVRKLHADLLQVWRRNAARRLRSAGAF